MTLPLPFERKPVTPTEVNRLIKRLIEGRTEEMWVKGELSNVTKAASGHIYFSLKDRESQLRAVMWRTQALKVRFRPIDGMEVEVRGRISVYEPRGEYQLVAAEMNPAGQGALFVALEALKKKLTAEGFFDPDTKKKLPAWPETVGIVTSPTGAALRDIIRVARQRWPGIRLVLAPVPVQGEGASIEIADAIRRMNAWGKAQVLIVGRGGGSMEDLWSFNEEPVVRAVARSRIPVISAVGHETDVTLCDLAADCRAATPSNAAEIAVPDAREAAIQVRRLEAMLLRLVTRGLAERKRRVEAITAAYGFRRPHDFMERGKQRVDILSRQLADAMGRRLTEQKHAVINQDRVIRTAVLRLLADRKNRLDRSAARLSGLDPHSVLKRGYAFVQNAADGHVVRRAAELEPGDRVRLRFHADAATGRIETIEDVPGALEPQPGEVR